MDESDGKLIGNKVEGRYSHDGCVHRSTQDAWALCCKCDEITVVCLICVGCLRVPRWEDLDVYCTKCWAIECIAPEVE